MILWPLVALAVVALAFSTIHWGAPALEHRKYERMMENTARLEAELGIGTPALEALETRVTTAWRQRSWTEPERRVTGHCNLCGRMVAINAGRCDIAYRDRSRCAKEIWYAGVVDGSSKGSPSS